jgi:hypothetical protein
MPVQVRSPVKPASSRAPWRTGTYCRKPQKHALFWLAKVGVEGSNPFARSNSSDINPWLRYTAGDGRECAGAWSSPKGAFALILQRSRKWSSSRCRVQILGRHRGKEARAPGGGRCMGKMADQSQASQERPGVISSRSTLSSLRSRRVVRAHDPASFEAWPAGRATSPGL